MRSEPTQRGGPADPLRQIAQCHEKIAGHLARLDSLAAADDETVARGREAVESIVRWFETNGARHRLDEDESVFPRLAGVAPELDAALGTLAAEHAEEDGLVRELAAAMHALAQDPVHGPARARAAARRLVAHFRGHLDVEERVVLPAAGRALGTEVLAAVAAEMERRRTEGSCA